MSDWNGNTATADETAQVTVAATGHLMTGDPEVDAIIGVTSILSKLTEEQRGRVLGNANDRFGTPPPAQAKRGK